MIGKYYESDYEKALIQLLEEQGWQYTYGGNIPRNNREVLPSHPPPMPAGTSANSLLLREPKITAAIP